MEEIWKDIKGYEGLYQVSNFGRVKNMRTGRILKNNMLASSGYYFVFLYKDKNRSFEYIHRLVAMTFLDNKDNLPCVNHIDEDPSNNIVSNLEWCTYRYNNRYGTKQDRISNSLKGFYKNNKSPLIGRKLSEETKQKISDVKKGVKFTEEQKKNMLKSEETKQKISLSMKIYYEKKKELN